MLMTLKLLKKVKIDSRWPLNQNEWKLCGDDKNVYNDLKRHMTEAFNYTLVDGIRPRSVVKLCWLVCPIDRIILLVEMNKVLSSVKTEEP